MSALYQLVQLKVAATPVKLPSLLVEQHLDQLTSLLVCIYNFNAFLYLNICIKISQFTDSFVSHYHPESPNISPTISVKATTATTEMQTQTPGQ